MTGATARPLLAELDGGVAPPPAACPSWSSRGDRGGEDCGEDGVAARQKSAGLEAALVLQEAANLIQSEVGTQHDQRLGVCVDGPLSLPKCEQQRERAGRICSLRLGDAWRCKAARFSKTVGDGIGLGNLPDVGRRCRLGVCNGSQQVLAHESLRSDAKRACPLESPPHKSRVETIAALAAACAVHGAAVAEGQRWKRQSREEQGALLEHPEGVSRWRNFPPFGESQSARRIGVKMGRGAGGFAP